MKQTKIDPYQLPALFRQFYEMIKAITLRTQFRHRRILNSFTVGTVAEECIMQCSTKNLLLAKDLPESYTTFRKTDSDEINELS
ncbi:unnamed protein product [Acanthoscelides obtectus]|uniref:Uncharacterized protein n=1 Tax=Acanthoscelides obtectus TaxID=200917 RepID=A0A9P0KJK2_ACAOB|nr:unnamed protein product [Acanthoscelides obtectus]CAK1672400.1 hypothetical protein AOBTE_LOCUS28859 [Acanthoscelides obtectus]